MKRSPITRRVGLARRSRLRPVSAARASEAKERVRVRGLVFERDGWRCRMAPLGGCWGVLTFHHVKKASQGGAYSVENGATLCAFHNDLIESDADIAAVAESMGLVRHWWEGVQRRDQ